MNAVTYVNPPELPVSPAFSQAIRIPAGYDLVVVGGQNGIDATGRLVADDLGGQARQAMANVQVCLEAAGARLDQVVRWSVLVLEEAPLQEGFGAFVQAWGGRPNPPAITVARVGGLAVPGALCEIEALAAVPPANTEERNTEDQEDRP